MCHGKCTPLSRVRVGDGIGYYSSVERLGTKDKCQRFTAIGSVTPTDVSAPADAKPYQVAISPGAPSMRLARVLGGVVGESERSMHLSRKNAFGLWDSSLTRPAGFKPFRINIQFDHEAVDTPIVPLIPSLTFIKDKQKWGAPFRFGFLELPAEDFALIESHMLRGTFCPPNAIA